MEKIKRALGYISMAVMILVLLYVKYAYERGLELWPIKTKLQHDEVKVERKIKIPEGETMEFIQPAYSGHLPLYLSRVPTAFPSRSWSAFHPHLI